MSRQSFAIFLRNVVVAVTIMMLWPVIIMTFAISEFRSKRRKTRAV